MTDPKDPQTPLSRSLVDRKGSFIRVVALGPQFVVNSRVPPLTPAAQAVLTELGAEFKRPVRDGQFLKVGEVGGTGLLVLARDTEKRSNPPYETVDGEIAVDPRADAATIRSGVTEILARKAKK